MKIHEYQAKQILCAAGVTVPRGIVADTPKAVANAFHELGGELAVIKAQIHADMGTAMQRALRKD